MSFQCSLPLFCRRGPADRSVPVPHPAEDMARWGGTIQIGSKTGGLRKFVRVTCLALAASVSATAAWAAPAGFQKHSLNGRDPITRGGETTFHIRNGDCSSKDYGDGRGENNCWNGNVSSRLVAGGRAQPGQEREYAFEVWVDPNFRYSGNRLEIALWQRINTVKNHMYELKMSTTRGVTFEGMPCFGRKSLGRWNSFRMRVKWSKDADGYIKVVCNDRVILERTGNTLVPPGCGSSRKPQCAPKLQRLQQPIQWQVGPLMSGYGGPPLRGARRSAFETFQEDGITVKMRRLYSGRPRSGW